MKYDDSWFGILSKSAFSGLREYYQKNESLLKSEKGNDLTKIRKKAKAIGKKHKLSKDEEYGEFSLLEDQHEITYDMFFANFFRYSVVVLVYLILEDHLNKFCLALYKEKKLSKPPPKRGSIYKYERYIQRVHLSYDQSVWDFISDLRYIRNCIVHASGNVSRREPEERSELDTIVKKDIGIHIGGELAPYRLKPLYLDDDSIIVEPRYCETIINSLTTLFETLCKAAGLQLEFKVEISE